MNFALTDMLYVALVCYTVGTVAALLSLFIRTRRVQHFGLLVMTAGFVAHTIWIGTICARTGHPPITNLAEASSFVAWTVFVVELFLWFRYKVYAAAFFVHPLVLLLMTLSAVVGENVSVLDPKLRSSLFTTHLFLSSVGVAGLLIGLAFGLLAFLQDRALKNKTRGRLWEWIPSLDICQTVSYRALAVGFSIYTLGLLAGVLWSYRTQSAAFADLRVKQIGAVVAWILFGILLQSYVNDTYRRRRTLFLSGAAFAAIVVAILGIKG